jgi:cytochrome b561
MVTAERLLRFTRTERAAHWLVVAAFAAILLSGTQMPHRWDADQPVVDIHVGCAALLVAGLALLLWRADRASLVRTGVQLATTEPGDGPGCAASPTGSGREPRRRPPGASTPARR